MRYLINFAIDGDPKISCACADNADETEVIQVFAEMGITLHEVNWLSYFLQKHGMNRIAALLAMSL